ncbi:polymorphic toxin type 5 domain-containing protein [Nocardia transvalensis]|uniref:polymorphic toxin type 5 domain-containing protein n=1 Tax=Nocardia transvalensis TaxID=37333 RepID=UPI0018938397|nr:polymorphic toxin type 5 domain-containing protein [Nocardia transvalensis]MBF6328325.1 hypothetical protein [Nocardia transvalensis]
MTGTEATAAPAISVQYTGTAASENPRGVEEAIRRGIAQAVREHHDTVDPKPLPRRERTDVHAAEREFHVLGDLLRIGQTPSSPVLGFGRDIPQWVRAGGNLEVEADDPVRAVEWGTYLFGARGFAVLTSAQRPGRLLVRPLATPLRAADFGGFAPAVSREPGGEGTVTSAPATGATFLTDASLQPLTITTAEGIRLYRTYRAQSPTDWSGQNIDRRLADPTDPGRLRASDVGEVVHALTLEHSDDLAVAHVLATLDRSLFAAMSLEDRRRYLLALMRLSEKAISGVDSDQLGAALVDLIASCRSTAELDALLAPLATDGSLLRLFARFDKPTFRLLHAVGAHVPLTPLEPGQLMDIVVYQLRHPLSTLDVVEFVGTAYDWLRATVSSLADLPLLPVELGGSLPELYELYMVLCRALGTVPVPIPGVVTVTGPPDPEALAQLRTLLASAGTAGRQALQGLQHIEELAGAAGAVGSALLRRVAQVILLEILAAYLTAPRQAAAAAQRISAQARLFEALAAALRLQDAGEVGRLMRLLPESAAEDVLRLLRQAPPRARTLARFLAANEQAGESGERLLAALRIARTVQETLGPATELAEDVVAGTRRVLELVRSRPNWSGSAVRAVLARTSDAELADLLRVAGRLTADQVGALGPAEFAGAAGAQGALRFVTEAGGHALAPTVRLFGSHATRYKHFLAQVAAAKRRLGPQQYYELLERLAAGDRAGFDDAEWLSEVAGELEKKLRPGARPLIPASALGDIAAISSRAKFRRAVTAILRENPGHPLRFLLNDKGVLRSDMGDFAHWLEHPDITEAGHLASGKSLGATGADRFVVMSRYRNRLAASVIEHPAKGGYMVNEFALDIEGIPVDPQTALDWVAKGHLDPAVVDRAPFVRYQPE